MSKRRSQFVKKQEKPLFPENKSIIFDAIKFVCQKNDKALGLEQARKRYGRYMATELLVFASLFYGTVFLIWFPVFPRWSHIPLLLLYTYRIFNMAIAHIGILLLDMGKSTPEPKKIHSRLRYLALTVLNLLEVMIFGSLWLLCIQGLGVKSKHYSAAFATTLDVFYYNLKIASRFTTEGVWPLTSVAYLHNVMLSVLGVLLLGVVLAILFSKGPEDEIYPARK